MLSFGFCVWGQGSGFRVFGGWGETQTERNGIRVALKGPRHYQTAHGAGTALKTEVRKARPSGSFGFRDHFLYHFPY